MSLDIPGTLSSPPLKPQTPISGTLPPGNPLPPPFELPLPLPTSGQCGQGRWWGQQQPSPFTFTVSELLTKFPHSGPGRMAGREGEGTSGSGFTGMLGLTCRTGGVCECVCGGLALSNGAGRGSRRLPEVGQGPRGHAPGAPTGAEADNGGGSASRRPKGEPRLPAPPYQSQSPAQTQRVPAPPWGRRKWAAAPGGAPLPALCPGCNAPSQKAGWRAGWARPPPRSAGLGGPPGWGEGNLDPCSRHSRRFQAEDRIAASRCLGWAAPAPTQASSPRV